MWTTLSSVVMVTYWRFQIQPRPVKQQNAAVKSTAADPDIFQTAGKARAKILRDADIAEANVGRTRVEIEICGTRTERAEAPAAVKPQTNNEVCRELNHMVSDKS